MLWLVVCLGAAAPVLARPFPGAADASVFNSDRAGNYSFHISVDRLEVQNVNFNVHLAVFLGGSAHHPTYQPPQEQHQRPGRPGRPPVTTVALGPADYARHAAPFVLAYPLPLWAAEGWKGVAPWGDSSPLASPPRSQSTGTPRPEDHSVSPPQPYPPSSSSQHKVTTFPSPQFPAVHTRPEERTTMPPPNPDLVTRSEKLNTTSPPQYPALETHSATSETLQTL